jgi:hypothetical protein
VLGQRQQPLGLRGHGYALVGVQMHDDPRVLPRGMDGGVDGEARGVDREGRVLDHVAVRIDLDQRRGGDLLEEQAVGVDQEVVLRPRDPGRNVGEDHVVPAVQGHGPVERGEFHARPPLLLAHASPQYRRLRRRDRTFGHVGPS